MFIPPNPSGIIFFDANLCQQIRHTASECCKHNINSYLRGCQRKHKIP